MTSLCKIDECSCGTAFVMAMAAPSDAISRVRLGGWGGWGQGCEASKAYYLESEAVVSFPDARLVSKDGVSFGLNRAVLAATSNLLNGVLRSSSEEEAEELVIRQETGFFVITSQGQKEYNISARQKAQN